MAIDAKDDLERSKTIRVDVRFEILKPTSSGCTRKFPRRFNDFLPSLSTALPHMPAPVPRNPPPSSIQPMQSPETTPGPDPRSNGTPEPGETIFTTEADEFGLYRCYFNIPSFIPDMEISLEDTCDDSSYAIDRSCVPHPLSLTTSPFASSPPFANPTIFRLMQWFYGHSNMKSVSDLDHLVKDILLADDFDQNHLRGFNAGRELKRLDDYGTGPGFVAEDGWDRLSVTLKLPCEKFKNRSEAEAREFVVEGVYCRRLTEVIKSAFQEINARRFHLTPFKLFFNRLTTARLNDS